MNQYVPDELITLPLLPLRDLCPFPRAVMHFDVGRTASKLALDRAMAEDRKIMLVAQKDANCDAPTQNDLYPTGTIAQVGS